MSDPQNRQREGTEEDSEQSVLANEVDRLNTEIEKLSRIVRCMQQSA